AVHGADPRLLRLRRGFLEGVPRLVGELAEVHLEPVRRLAEHADVGARAEDALLARREDDGADLGMLEAQPLNGVIELDVHAEIVRVELQLVAGPEPAILLHVHGQRGDRAIDGEPPVLVAGRLGPEVDWGRLHDLRPHPRITHKARALPVPRFSQLWGEPPSRSAESPASSTWRSPLYCRATRPLST